MTTPDMTPGADPQDGYAPSDAVRPESPQSVQPAEQTMPASAISGADSTQAMPTQTMPTQAMPQIPSQQFPQSADVVYRAMKDTLLKSQSFMLVMADDVIKTANVTSRNDGATYMVQVMENPLGGSVVQFIPQGQPVADMRMESMVFFGELNRELMMQQMAASAQQNPAVRQNANGQQTWSPQGAGNGGAAHAPKKPAAWVIYVAIGALVLAVVSLVLLIVLTPKTGAWLVWVLGLVSLAFSGFSLYAALALGKDMIARILSTVAAVVSVLALVLGFVNVPKAAPSAAGAKQPVTSSSVPQSDATSTQGADADTSDDGATDGADDGLRDQQGDANNQKPADANSFDGILAAIEADEKSAVENINAKEAEAAGKLGETYESYVSNKQAITDWYAALEKETGIFYGKVSANVTKYFQMLAQQVQADPDMDWDAVTENFYDSVYDTDFDNFYDDIYDTAFDDVYDKYYDGALEYKPENVEYKDYYEERSECYKAWSNARSDFYKAWSNMRSNIYKLWSEVRSTLWKDKYDFNADIERFQKKCAPYIAQ